MSKLNSVFFIKNLVSKHKEIFLTIAFLLGTLAIDSNKLLFLWCLLYFILTYFIVGTFFKTILITLIPLSFITTGQNHSRVLVPPEAISSDNYEGGRKLFFDFSPYYLFLISNFIYTLLYLVKQRMQRRIRIPKPYVFFLLSVFFIVLSSSFAHNYPDFSLIFSFSEVALISFSLLFFIFISKLRNQIDTNNFFKQILLLFSLCIIFASGITVLQFFSRSSLGLIIEQRSSIPAFGDGADENQFQFRPFGIYSHANIMANNALVWFVTLSTFLIFLQPTLSKNEQRFIAFALACSVIDIILSQSRSVYLALFFYILVALKLHLFSVDFILNSVNYLRKKSKLLFFVVLAVATIIIVDRALYSTYTFSKTGGADIRSELNREAIELIKQNFWFGVGKGMFIPANYHASPNGVSSYFPESVHNGFLLIMAEEGFFAVTSLVVAYYFLMVTLYKSSYEINFKNQIAVSFATLSVPMFFQPFDNSLTWFLALILPLVVNTSKVKVSKINSRRL